VFEVWMGLLRNVPGSVLWLLQGGPAASDRLRREAGARGVAPERLVFAPRITPAEHLARHRVADLFIDTWPCNAHTTASDALWAGLPVLTCTGETFAARVGASLLHAVGLPELVTHSTADYAALAVALATDPPRLAALRGRLAAQRSIAPLFDTARFTRGLEAAFAAMWARHANGEPPASFAVPP
jgi:predicted O-linked N-acetylglucosamine transferase (SPINDLY family)